MIQPPDPLCHHDARRNFGSDMEDERDLPKLIEGDNGITFFHALYPRISRVHLKGTWPSPYCGGLLFPEKRSLSSINSVPSSNERENLLHKEKDSRAMG